MATIKLILMNPLSPSCDMLKRRVTEMIDLKFEGKEILVNISVCDNISVCTPNKIAKMANLTVEQKLIEKQLNRARDTIDFVCHPSNLWSRELEALHKPLREAAEDRSLLMVPVFIIDGAVMCHGNVPNPCEIEEWINEALK